MFRLLSKLFKSNICEHSYKFYNIGTLYDSFGYGYYEYQFVCTKCGKEVNVTQREINDRYEEINKDYRKRLVMGGQPINSREFSIPRYQDCDICYWSPSATLLLEHYSSRGIDLRQIKPKRYPHCEGTMTEVNKDGAM